MQNNDLSNEIPKRLIITTDFFVQEEVIPDDTKRKLFRKPKVKKKKIINRAYLSRLYLYAQKVPYNLELVSFDMDDEQLAEFADTLDKAGVNPFRFCTSYDSVEHLVADLPYRPEVIGVLDTPTRLLRYGSKGLDIGVL